MKPAVRRRARRSQSGFSLIEGLVSIVLLSFGVLGLARFQVDMVRQSTDAQNRLAAADLADALLSYVRVDPANAACYTLPQAGGCASTAAQALAATWKTEAEQRGFTAVTATLVGPSQLTTSLGWTSRAFHVARSLEVTTDVRP